METIKFKTTLKCSGCVAKATPFLNEALGHGKWQVDLNNQSKVLTVTGTNDQDKVLKAVNRAGFKAELLQGAKQSAS